MKNGWLQVFIGVPLMLIGLPFILIGIAASFIFDMMKEGFKQYMEWTRP